MPKNISKLIKKASETANYPTEQMYIIEPNPAFCARFAELIIKECGKRVDDFTGGEYAGLIGQDLKNHFGLKK